jgi:hypothetical protein
VAERVFPARAFEIGGGQIVPSPNQFYLTGEDNLRVVSANAVVGVRIKIACRTANPQGATVAQGFDHVPASDRSRRTEDFSIGAGSLLNVTAYVSVGTPPMGLTYIIVQIVRGVGAAAVVLGTVLAGYITSSQALGFPGSPIQSSIEGDGAVRVITGTVPAMSVGAVEIVPTGARWELYSCVVNLVSDVSVQARWIYLGIWTAAGRVAISPQLKSQGGSTTLSFYWGQGLVPRDVTILGLSISDFVRSLKLQAGDYFTIDWTGHGANDQLTAPIFTVREWLEGM